MLFFDVVTTLSPDFIDLARLEARISILNFLVAATKQLFSSLASLCLRSSRKIQATEAI